MNNYLTRDEFNKKYSCSYEEQGYYWEINKKTNDFIMKGFEKWKAKLDLIISENLNGLTSEDFSDSNWFQYWEDELTPIEALESASDDGNDDVAGFLKLFN